MPLRQSRPSREFSEHLTSAAAGGNSSGNAFHTFEDQHHDGGGMLGRAGKFINKNLGNRGGGNVGNHYHQQQQQYAEARSDIAGARASSRSNAPPSQLPPRAAPAVISPPTSPTSQSGYLPPSPQGVQPRFGVQTHSRWGDVGYNGFQGVHGGSGPTSKSHGMGPAGSTGGGVGGSAFRPPPPIRTSSSPRNAAAVAGLNERMNQYKASVVAGGSVASSPWTATGQQASSSLPRFNQINNFVPPPPTPKTSNLAPREMRSPAVLATKGQGNAPGAAPRTLMTSQGQGQAPSDRAQASQKASNRALSPTLLSPRKLFGATAAAATNVRPPSSPAASPVHNSPGNSPSPSSFGDRHAQRRRLQQTIPASDQRDPSEYDEDIDSYETETRGSYGIDVGSSTSIDDTRTYDTGTVGSATLWSASYTTREDEETATYMSGADGPVLIKTALSGETEVTAGTDAYQSLDSAYQASRSSYETDRGRAADHRDDTKAPGSKKKGSRFSRWKKARKAAAKKQSTGGGDDDNDDDNNKDAYAAVHDRKQSRGQGKGAERKSKSNRNRTSTYSPRSLLPSPSAGTATVAAYVEKRDADKFFEVKQRYGYLSIILTLVQTIILVSMVAFCGLAPMNINEFIGPYPDALSEWGAKNAYLMLEMGQWWRFFTPQLLSAGLLHLLCNGYVQLTIAAFFEREWGSTRWGVIYFCSAVGSTITSTILDPDSISVGSSGALMGIFGAKLAEVLTKTAFDTFHGRDGTAVEQLGGTLCSLVIVCILSVMPMIDWSGHMGGLATGFFLGMPIFGKLIRKLHWKALWQLFGLALYIACLGLAINELVNEVKPSDALGDACDFYKELYTGHDYDCTCAVSNLFVSSNSNNNYEESDAGADDDGEGDVDNAQGWEEEEEEEDAQDDMDQDDEGQGDQGDEEQSDDGEEGDAERMLRRMMLR